MANSIRENVSDELLREICNGSPFTGAFENEVVEMARELIEFRTAAARDMQKLADLERAVEVLSHKVGSVSISRGAL
ncbi:hypothetical protein DZA65_00787 [Dickeya dianthicola]|uniref:Uncharacterized protein n=1 Tax=Dickeya dianthicola TaxID=204039 RepID=A0AAP6S4H3_9GAMM|nr:hypothetical protein [Dickeya dianthicola]AYC17693.1 hypothetical protein DZA65_00787 [Dickeya dianthicola]MBI0436510.1 hypothetical protein [Dickeya dianthicola]MBI0448236.1 hypothetical protein [Dickeya dianthicola]MBI0452850.1 hypothetical protein [Dickeya dianthicola]MBI0457368.1 hypothetical protein [Dickeya dianthicola]